MGTYAVMSGNVVSNIIVADNKEDAETSLGVVLVEFTPEKPSGIGWIYDEEKDSFSDPTERNDV